VKLNKFKTSEAKASLNFQINDILTARQAQCLQATVN
jgi:hypothetical protein